jgi:hypothetical protein
MAAMEHEEARAAAAARAREADPFGDYGYDADDDPRGTVQDPRGMPVYGGGRDTEVYR